MRLASEHLANRADMDELESTERDAVLEAVCYVLRYSLEGRPLGKTLACPAPDQAADRVLEQLERSGWRLVRLPPIPPHSTG